jgi:SAM-dependent methyltransferase
MAQAGSTIKERFYPEAKFGGFSRVDGSIEFYTRISAIIKPTDRVLDYGAGRGAQIDTDPHAWGRWLKTLKGRVAHVEGCDVDDAVFENPYLDHATLFDPDKPLPFGDNSFDLVYSNWVFEHVADPQRVANELLRVVKPGGYICAVTPNKRGYIALAARLAGNARHVSLLKRIQPDRFEIDVFPTHYRLNTRQSIERYFDKGAEVVVYGMSSEPAYYFNNKLVYGLFNVLHKLTPGPFHTALFIFIRKKQA